MLISQYLIILSYIFNSEKNHVQLNLVMDRITCPLGCVGV